MTQVARLTEARSPERPGPGPIPDPLLRALDFDVRRRIEGLLLGDFRSPLLGHGTELAQIRRYVPGDDVRDMDWNVTARTGEPHVRVHVAERVLTSWLLLDVSASMSFGTADRRKADVAEGVALALGHVATRGGNRLGLMTFGQPRGRIIPPAQGRAAMLSLLTTLRREQVAYGGGRTSLERTLTRANAVMRSRGAVFIVSDFMGPKDWRRPLLRLASRHEIVAIEIRDPRESELPDIGHVWFVDPETGRRLRVDTRKAETRARFAEAAATEHAEVTRLLRAARADHLLLSTSGDWLHPLARFLAGRRGKK